MVTTLELMHGTDRTSWSAHIGMCLTDDELAAESYAGAGRSARMIRVTLELSGLHVAEVASYDRDGNVAVGDDGELCDADVVVYGDEDMSGRQHRTWRLMSARALAALTI